MSGRAVSSSEGRPGRSSASTRASSKGAAAGSGPGWAPTSWARACSCCARASSSWASRACAWVSRVWTWASCRRELAPTASRRVKMRKDSWRVASVSRAMATRSSSSRRPR
ncbi:hypothetical protein GY15_20025 [Delftia sp. 670]|nr:hypothetical protein GY15_20025 [Delftia sp. 670]